jgi:hypothetical protein
MRGSLSPNLFMDFRTLAVQSLFVDDGCGAPSGLNTYRL